jgi:hypothetical protein
MEHLEKNDPRCVARDAAVEKLRGGQVRGVRKAFFSEEKNQKTFSDAVADRAGGTNT